MTPPIPGQGSLAETPLPKLLLSLMTGRVTGRLDLASARTHKGFWVQDGFLVESESELPGERLTQVLHDAGALSSAERDEIDRDASRRKGPEAAALLGREGLEPKQVLEGIREQIRRRAVDCFGWSTGSFEWTPCEEGRPELDAFRVDVFDLVHRGLQQHWSLDQLLEPLTARMDEYPSAGPRLGKIIRRLELDPTIERMVAGLSGRRKLGGVIGASAGSPAALATFWVLDAAGALVYADAPPSEDGDAPPEIEIEIRDDAAPGAAETASTAAAPQAAAPAAPGPETSTSPEAEKMRAEVLERLEQLDDLDYYALLGVEKDAAHAAIRKAYFLTAKRYHPDAIARLGLADIRQEAGEVFAKIAEANEVLSDPQRRQEYDRALEGGMPDVDVQVLAQAETFYRKGEILMNMGDFRGALEYLKNAVELYPDEAAYQNDLGWAYFKKNPPEPEVAIVHIRAALELDPSDAVARFREGVVSRELA